MKPTVELEETVKLSASFADADGAAADPTVLTLATLNPNGLLTLYTYGVSPELIKDSVGNYHLSFDVTVAGRWWYRWEALGSTKTVIEDFFQVRKSAFP